MPKFENKPYSKDDYDKNAENTESLKKQMAGAKTADEMMAIAMKMKAAEGNENELMGNAQEEAGKEDAERTKKKEEAEARTKELEGLKLKDETESAMKAEALLKKIKGENVEDTVENTEKSAEELSKMINQMEELKNEKQAYEGAQCYTALAENQAGFKKFFEAQGNSDIELQKLDMSKAELEFKSGDFQGRDTSLPETKDILDYQQGEKQKKIKWNEDMRLNKSEDDIKWQLEQTKTKLREGNINGRTILKPEDLPRSLKARYDENFDKGLKQERYQTEQPDIYMAQGAGIAALEAGDLENASSFLAFSESIKSLAGKLKDKFDDVFSSLDVSKREKFLSMVEEKKKTQRNYESEIKRDQKK